MKQTGPRLHPKIDESPILHISVDPFILNLSRRIVPCKGREVLLSGRIGWSPSLPPHPYAVQEFHLSNQMVEQSPHKLEQSPHDSG